MAMCTERGRVGGRDQCNLELIPLLTYFDPTFAMRQPTISMVPKSHNTHADTAGPGDPLDVSRRLCRYLQSSDKIYA